MSQVKENIFYDSPPEKAWFLTFEALYIKNRDHRRILNMQPEIKQTKKYVDIIFNIKILSN
jgi:hypothetical protein